MSVNGAEAVLWSGSDGGSFCRCRVCWWFWRLVETVKSLSCTETCVSALTGNGEVIETKGTEKH